MVHHAASEWRNEEVTKMTIVNDTIVAQATPPGRGGVAILRVSGPLVQSIMQSVLATQLKPREATYLPFIDENNQTIDEGIAIYFKNPNSFTGEDVLELQGHGGPFIVDLLLTRIVQLGARIARPGEFSERAFLNDKLDLTQAEAIADLINASSTHAAKLAMRSLQGDFSKLIHTLVDKMIYLRMYVEAAIDFTDEEIDFLSDDKITEGIKELISRVSEIEANAKQGSLLREGITVVIVGEPNVGKSSLLNRLSGKDIAIVTDIPGTTRDVLREQILIDDIPLHIIDTAGIRKSDDPVEQEGIRRAHLEIENADLILCLQEVNGDELLLPNIASHQPVIYVRNKIDLMNRDSEVKDENGKTVIYLSAKLNTGIDLLKQVIKERVGYRQDLEGAFLARRRHLDALSTAHKHLQSAFMQVTQSKSGELAAEELRLAQLAMNTITGEFTTDDLLTRIFASFCVGK